MTVAEVPRFEHDWQPLRRALREALWDGQVVLPKRVEIALVEAVIDLLEGEGTTLSEAD